MYELCHGPNIYCLGGKRDTGDRLFFKKKSGIDRRHRGATFFSDLKNVFHSKNINHIFLHENSVNFLVEN